MLQRYLHCSANSFHITVAKTDISTWDYTLPYKGRCHFCLVVCHLTAIGFSSKPWCAMPQSTPFSELVTQHGKLRHWWQLKSANVKVFFLKKKIYFGFWNNYLFKTSQRKTYILISDLSSGWILSLEKKKKRSQEKKKKQRSRQLFQSTFDCHDTFKRVEISHLKTKFHHAKMLQ